MLPNINGKQATETAPGINPNERTKSTGSLLGQYSSSVLSQLSDNISPSNFIRQGTYGAFGNNVLTRSAMGAMDATGDLLDKFLGIKGEDEEETPTDKLLKEQIKLLTKTTEEIDDTNKILKELLEVEKTKVADLGKKTEQEETEVKDIKKKKKKVKVSPTDFKDSLLLSNDKSMGLESSDKEGILATIAKDVVDIKEILTHGFESVTAILDKDSSGEYKGFRKKRKLNDVEDAVILSETKFGDKGKNEKSLIQKYRIETMKILKRIALGVDKIYEVVAQSQDMTAPEDKAEAIRREKHMGMVEEVKEAPKLEAPPAPEGDSGDATGAVTAVITLLLTQMKNLKTIIVDMFKAGIEKFKGALESAWEFGKKTVSNVFSYVKEKGGSLIESAEKAAGAVAEKVAGAGGVKAIAKKGLGSILKATPVVGELVAGGLAAYDAWDASKDAKNILGIEGRDATTGEKIEAGVGGAVESLSFGLISKEKTAKWIDGLMTSKDDKQDELTKKQEELNSHVQDKVSPPADAAGAPSVSVNTTNNTYNSGRKLARNDDSSYNRYLDRHYAF